ncbi:MAG: sigma-70 family RNA polymerase sigma factor [Pseudoxanthomonas sp.]
MGHTATVARDRQPKERFGELLEGHRRIVFKVANTYGFHAEDRVDLAQEIAAQLWRAFPGCDPDKPFSTWMYRIALNVAISYVRNTAHRSKHSVPLDEALHDIADENGADHETDQQVRALHRFIVQLDKLNRALLLYLEDESYRQIAEILGISETNVATKLSRLKQRIEAPLAQATQK